MLKLRKGLEIQIYTTLDDGELSVLPLDDKNDPIESEIVWKYDIGINNLDIIIPQCIYNNTRQNIQSIILTQLKTLGPSM